jgi:hypothetical protein
VVGRRWDPTSRRRAGKQVRVMLRADIRGALRANWRRLVVVFVGWLVLVVVVNSTSTAFGSSDYVAGFSVGLMVGVLPLLWRTFLIGRGIAPRLMGAEAEEWTAAELARLDPRWWAIYHHVPLGLSDVDHVAVGPGRVYAIETKWTARGDVDRFLKGAGWQASRQAKELERVMRARGVRSEVIPLLVVWGPGIATSLGERPRMQGDVRVVAGANAKDWLRRMKNAADRTEVDSAALVAIEAHVRDPRTAREGRSVNSSVAGRSSRRPDASG